MNLTPLQKRYFLFLFGCIPTRLAFVILAKYGSAWLQVILGYIAFIIATGFIVIYAFKLRKTGLETGGEKIWWNDLRPLHSFLYYWFSWTILFGNKKEAWKILLGDVLLGLGSFIFHHYLNYGHVVTR